MNNKQVSMIEKWVNSEMIKISSSNGKLGVLRHPAFVDILKSKYKDMAIEHMKINCDGVFSFVVRENDGKTNYQQEDTILLVDGKLVSRSFVFESFQDPDLKSISTFKYESFDQNGMVTNRVDSFDTMFCDGEEKIKKIEFSRCDEDSDVAFCRVFEGAQLSEEGYVELLDKKFLRPKVWVYNSNSVASKAHYPVNGVMESGISDHYYIKRRQKVK